MRNFTVLGLIACQILFSIVQGFTPLVPTHGYTYYLEAARVKAWPSCPYRFLSYAENSNNIDLYNSAGSNQQWQVIDTGSGDGTFYLKTNFGKYLSYTGDCSSTVVDSWTAAGVNQKFRFVVGDNTQFEYYLEAAGRSQCEYKYVSFPVGCTTSSPDKIGLSKATGADQRFRIYPVSSTNPVQHNAATSFVCPDPYAWYTGSEYKIQCSWGMLPMGSSPDLNPTTSQFILEGELLGGMPAPWAADDNANRWAPENYETVDGKYNYVFFSDDQPDGKHRLGWARSSTGPKVNAYSTYSASYLDLGMAAGGDIDSTMFTDTNGKTYLVWKTDDNSVGSPTTRIWAQELSFANDTVTEVGSGVVLMDSAGLWWVTSFVEGGSLVEGPEMIFLNGYYYLFFAAGRYCTDSYTEGVARSRSFFGPYEKMTSPLLSTGIVGTAKSPSSGKQERLIGPGHGSIVHAADGSWKIVYHASIGDNCDRRAFIGNLKFGADGWPYLNM